MPSPAAPQAKFKVVDTPKLKKLSQIRRSHARSHLIWVAYANAGLLEDSAESCENGCG